MELSSTFFLLLLSILFLSTRSANTNVTDFSCTNTSCTTYLLYRTQPLYLDLGTVSDLLGVSRHSIAKANDLPSEDVTLQLGELLLVPVFCGCTGNRSFVNITYDIKPGNTFFSVSVEAFGRLTNYHAVQDWNPELVPTNLTIGQEVIFPIFCKCASKSQIDQEINFLISYAWQPEDNISAISKMMNTSAEAIRIANSYKNFSDVGNNPALIPVSALPRLPPRVYYSNKERLHRSKSTSLLITSILLGAVLFLILFSLSVAFYIRRYPPRRRVFRLKSNTDRANLLRSSASSDQFTSPVVLRGMTECLDNPAVFQAEAITEATSNLDETFRVGTAFYRAVLGGETYAVRLEKGDGNAELSILRKVNHANLVKLAGVSTKTDAGFFMVYEFAENGSLDEWLYPKKEASGARFLSWNRRLMIALDVANGLHYLHEHTRPSVVHGNIRTSNILLNGNFKSKISNFSRAKPASESVTPKIDVGAFGVVLLELLSGKRAVSSGSEIGMVLEVEDSLRKWMDTCLGENYPFEGALSLASMGRACTSEVESERPSMAEIVFSLSVLAYSGSSKGDSGEQLAVIDDGILAR